MPSIAARFKKLSATLLPLSAVLGLLLLNATAAQAAPFAYISNGASSTVSVVDTATNTVIATVPVGTGPGAVAVTPDGARVYVANESSSVSR